MDEATSAAGSRRARSGQRSAGGPRRPGRPLRLPEDPLPIHSPYVDPWSRLAWLLMVSRVHAAGGAYAGRAEFVAALRKRGLAADLPRVSRWESGQQAVPVQVLEAYESILHLPPTSLAVHSALLARAAGQQSTPAARLVEERVSDEVVELLIGRALALDTTAQAVLTGAEWIALTGAMTRYEAVFLSRGAWTRLCDRFLGELARTSGPDQVIRYEACATLISHPTARRHLLRSLGAWLTDPEAQKIDPMLNLMAREPHPTLNDLLIRLVHSPPGRLRETAMTVAAAKLACGHFTKAGVAKLGATLAAHLAGERPRATPATLDLAAQLPRGARGRLLEDLDSGQVKDRISALSRTGTLLAPTVAARLARSIAGSLLAASPGRHDLGTSDPMLERLVQELFHASAARRNLSARVLALSPHAPVLSELLVTLSRDTDHLIASAMWEAQERLGHHHGRLAVAAALDEDRTGLRLTAMTALQGCPDRLDDDETSAMLDSARSSDDEPTLAATIAVVGLRAPEHLDRIDQSRPAAARATRWWQEVGPALRDPEAVAPGASVSQR